MVRYLLVIFSLLVLFVGCDLHAEVPEVDFDTSTKVLRGQYEGGIASSDDAGKPSGTPVNLSVEATYESEFMYLVQGTLIIGTTPLVEYTLVGEVSTNTEKYIEVQHAPLINPRMMGTLTSGDEEVQLVLSREADDQWEGRIFYANAEVVFQVTRVAPTAAP